MSDAIESPETVQDSDDQEITRLVPSSKVDAPVQSWQMSSFDKVDTPSSSDISEQVYKKMEQALQPKLQLQAEVLKKEAYDTSYQKGYEEGLAQGREEGEKQGEAEARAQVMQALEPKLEQFDSILKSLQKPYDVLEQKLYSEIVDFSLHIAKTVIAKSVAEHKDWVLEAVQDAVMTLPESEGKIDVYLHPDDLAFLQISKPTVSEKWSLHEAHNVEAGTCLVKQDYSTVVNSWISRFDEISQQISQDVDVEQPVEKSPADLSNESSS